MRDKKLSVKARLTLAFGALTLIVTIISAMGLKDLNDSNARFDGFVKGINARAEMATTIRSAVDDRAEAVRNLVLVTSPIDVEIES